MKPMIEEMLAMGQLTNESGDKIEKLEDVGITFSMTMTEGFLTVVESVKELTEVIRQSLGGALSDISGLISNMPRDIEVDVGVNYRLNNDFPVSGIPVPEELQHGSPFQDFGRGTAAVLHGEESVVTAAQGRTLVDMVREAVKSGGGRSGDGTVINLNITGVLDEGGLLDTVQRKVVPMIVRTLEDGVNGSRTNMREALGVE